MSSAPPFNSPSAIAAAGSDQKEPVLTVAGQTQPVDATASKLERMREALLDLTNRNQLLNFKHSDRSRTHIRVIDEVPEVLFDRLVGDRPFRFKAFDRPAPPRDARTAQEPTWQEVAASLGIDPTFDLPALSPAPPARHTDNAIQVPHFTDVAARRLDGIRQTYRTLLEELGIPALFGAFGFLEWYDTPTEETPQFAPLALLPLEIDRARAGYQYDFTVRASGDEPQTNLALHLRLKRLGIELPTLEDSNGEAELAGYLARVRGQIRHMPRWRVRRFVTLGIFQSARQVMYQDLDPEKWAQVGGGLTAHPVLPRLLGLRTTDECFAGTPVEDDAFLAHLISDCDPSQRGAIARALGGGSMVIQGPPGTGKSETITNLITAAIGAGKRVLFIADKMAALNVVKDRLDAAGIGTHCLELHSTKTKKKAFLDDMTRAFNARTAARQPRDRGPLLEEMRKIERDISAYDHAISTVIGSVGMTLHDLIWASEGLQAQLPQLPSTLGKIRISAVETLDRDAMDEDCGALQHLEEAWWRVADSSGKTDRHPWRFVDRGDIDAIGQDIVKSAVQKWLLALEAIGQRVNQVPGLSSEISFRELERLSVSFTRLPVPGDAPEDILRLLISPESAESFQRLVEDLATVQQTHRTLSAFTTDVEATVPLAGTAGDLHRELQALVPDTETLEHVLATIPASRRKMAALLESGRVAERILKQCAARGAPELLVPTAVNAIVTLQACSAGAAIRLFGYRNEDTLDDALVESFAEIAERAADLRREHDRFDETYSGWRDRTASDLREHVLALRTTSFWGRLFSRPYKAATDAFMRLTSGPKARRLEMADRFEELARFKETWERWPARDEVVKLTGRAYRGMETDFKGLADCSRWARMARERVGALGGDGRWVLAVVFGAPVEELERIVGALSPDHCERLAEWVAQERTRQLEDSVRLAVERLDRVEALAGSLLRAGVRPDTQVGALSLVQSISEGLAARRDAVSRNQQGIELVGRSWAGFDTSLAPLQTASSIRRRIAEALLPADVERAIFEAPLSRLGELNDAGSAIAALLRQQEAALSQAEGAGVNVAKIRDERTTVEGALAILRSAARTPEHLAEWMSFRRAWEEACRSNGPRDFLNGLDWSQHPPEELVSVYRLAVYRNLCAVAQSRFPGLSRGTWSGPQLSKLTDKHAALDRERLAIQREALLFELAQTPVPEGKGAGPRSSEWALIRHEGEKKTRHQPIRTLMKNARRAIQALKPCFMMSPLSVAQYLEPGRRSFDLVVIDEASQMRPAESLGALLRAEQVIVVGDQQQLPPTAFFDSLERPDDDTSDNEEGTETDSMSSILDLTLSAAAPVCDLRWHYRSRHESLIQFSNKMFYEGRLHVFPSPAPERADLGVHGCLVSGVWEHQMNRIEADAVADAAVHFMRTTPDRSLGVVAMNLKQSELIRHCIDERLRTADIDYEERWKDTLQPFFVKNLENVQGDERDVIFISLTYGPSQVGQRPAQRFGPVNGEYGHRRLNVLFTRAKYQVMLFTSMRPDQVEVKEHSQRGVKALRAYLDFAFDRTTGGPGFRQGSPVRTRPNAQCITEGVAQYGLAVDVGVGSQNIALPLAVRHPERQGTYACAIDFDGFSDSVGREAEFRARARIFPEMLDRFQWKRVRTWTADWLRDPRSAKQELLRGVEASVGRRLTKRPSPPPPEAQRTPTATVGYDGLSTDDIATAAAETVTPAKPAQTAIPVEEVGRRDLEHPLIARIRIAPQFAAARSHEKWERLILPVVKILVSAGGSAPTSSIAQALGVPSFRVSGVLAEVQEQLNAGQHLVLAYSREAHRVELDVALLEQLAPASD